MPQEPLEAYLERMKGDLAFRAALMAKEDIADRIELICSHVIEYALEEMLLAEDERVQDDREKSDEECACCFNTASMLQGSSPNTAGYARPSKAIEQRFKD